MVVKVLPCNAGGMRPRLLTEKHSHLGLNIRQASSIKTPASLPGSFLCKQVRPLASCRTCNSVGYNSFCFTWSRVEAQTTSKQPRLHVKEHRLLNTLWNPGSMCITTHSFVDQGSQQKLSSAVNMGSTLCNYCVLGERPACIGH